MTKPNSNKLMGYLALFIGILGGASIWKGALYVGKHEGDTLHLMQIVFRMTEGQLPHLDFMTPIGALAFAPIAFFVERGMGIGLAIIWAQVAMAIAIAPAVWWVASSRLSGAMATYFGLIVMVLMLALVHGESQRSVSISMHYNRWAWAATFVAVVAAFAPPIHRKSSTVDGLIIGIMMVVMVMIKVTYFACFAIPVIIALLMTKQTKALFVAVATGIVLTIILTLFFGVSYWQAYIGDLLAVAGSEVRAQPGAPLSAVVGSPAYIGGSLLAIIGVILLRHAKLFNAGLLLLLLIPGFFYVTFQNFGNDPQWLLLLSVLLLVQRPEAGTVNRVGWDMGNALKIAAAMAFAFAAPSFFNLAYSPYRHLAVKEETYSPILPDGGIHTDLHTATLRALRIDGRIALDGEGSGLEAYAQGADRDPPSEFMGETFAYCTVELGLPAIFDAIVKDLETAGLADGKRLFAADLFSSHWLFGSLEPLEHGAPWFYGGLPGYHDADYLLVPLCPVAQDVQQRILEEITEGGTDNLTEVRRTPYYILYSTG